MREGKNIPVWFNGEDRRRVQEAAALAGYRHLSKYIRDRALGRHGESASTRSGLKAQADQQQLGEHLAAIEQSQATTQAMLAMVLGLVHKRATTGEVSALLEACEYADGASDLLARLTPDFATVLSRLSE